MNKYILNAGAVLSLAAAFSSVTQAASRPESGSVSATDIVGNAYSKGSWPLLDWIRGQFINQRAHVVTSNRIPKEQRVELEIRALDQVNEWALLAPNKQLSGLLYMPGMQLPQGTYRTVLINKNYGGYLTHLNLSKRTEARYTPDWEKKSNYFPLTIRTLPDDAKIRILNYKRTYRHGLMLPEGNYRVQISRAGYRTLIRDLKVKAKTGTYQLSLQKGRGTLNQTSTATASAKPLPLHISTQPGNARVRIMNIKPKFRNGMLLKPGRYQIRVDHPGYISTERNVTLKPGQTHFAFQLRSQ